MKTDSELGYGKSKWALAFWKEVERKLKEDKDINVEHSSKMCGKHIGVNEKTQG